MPTIKFHFLKYIYLKNRRKLKDYLICLFEKKDKKLHHLSYIFCSDEYLLKINQQYLNHHYYTDIITFDLSSNKKCVEAEIYISIDRIKENAHFFEVTTQEELHRVIFHGALHLCGFRDKNKKDREKMRIQENRLLRLYNNAPRGT